MNYCTDCNEKLALHADGTIACGCNCLDGDAPVVIPDSWDITRDEVMAKRICEKLGISTAELNAMFTNCPVDGYVGTEVAARIDLDRLTDEERAWLEE